MPMYEYKCGACNHLFERFEAAGGGKGTGPECPRCGKKAGEKLFSTFASSCGGGNGGSVSGGCGSGGFT